MAKKKKTYRRARARKYFYKRKKGVYSSNGTLKARFVKVVRIMVLNNMQGAGDGYHWFNYNAHTVIQHLDLNLWTDILKPDADFNNVANQYPMFKPYAVALTAIPSNMNVNSSQNRRDCTAMVTVYPVRQAVLYNTRQLILDPLHGSKMYWKVGNTTNYCYCNPSATQEQTDNNNLITIHLGGNSDVQPYELCPVWTVRLCVYVKFKAKSSD